MSIAALARKLLKLESLAGARALQHAATLDLLRCQPDQIMLRAGMTPDPWQQGLLSSTADQILILAARQSGKSAVAAAMALRAALLRPHSPVLLLSPSHRQSGELFRKIVHLFDAVKRPMAVVAQSGQRLELANGSRIISLPGTEGTIRGFSDVAMLIIDEAARVSDALYYSVRPMLAVSRGRLVALSTPFGKRGFFHDEWHGTGPWERVRITAEQCPRITAAFLAEERRALGERFYRQEYLTSFEDVIDAVFRYEDIQAALSNEVKPLFAR
jgi:hypothetical protein